MRLTIDYYFSSDGSCEITEAGWLELRKFCEAIIYKRVGAKPYTEDLISQAMIECVEKIPKYDPNKNSNLGGFLAFVPLGVISKAACKIKKEIPFDFTSKGATNICLRR